MEFRKMLTMTLYARQQRRHWCKNRLLDSVGEGEGGMIWENSIEACILSFVKQIDSPSSMYEVEWHWGMGCWGRCEQRSGGETHVHPWLIHVNVCQKTWQYCKVINLQGSGGEGGGRGESGWGTHVDQWLIHVNVWQKPLQYGFFFFFNKWIF